MLLAVRTWCYVYNPSSDAAFVSVLLYILVQPSGSAVLA